MLMLISMSMSISISISIFKHLSIDGNIVLISIWNSVTRLPIKLSTKKWSHDVRFGMLHSSDDALSTSLRQTLCTRVPLRSTRRHRAPLAGELSAVLISCSLAARPPCSETLAMSYCSAQVVLFSKPRWFCFASLLTFHWVTGRTDILRSKGWYPCTIV